MGSVIPISHIIAKVAIVFTLAALCDCGTYCLNTRGKKNTDTFYETFPRLHTTVGRELILM